MPEITVGVDNSDIRAIRERINTDYRHVQLKDEYKTMLTDLKRLYGELNLVAGFWQSAEKEINEIRDCDKCDLCEDHYA